MRSSKLTSREKLLSDSAFSSWKEGTLVERRQSLEVHLWPFGRVAVWVPVRLSGFAPRGSPVCVSVGGSVNGPCIQHSYWRAHVFYFLPVQKNKSPSTTYGDTRNRPRSRAYLRRGVREFGRIELSIQAVGYKIFFFFREATRIYYICVHVKYENKLNF